MPQCDHTLYFSCITIVACVPYRFGQHFDWNLGYLVLASSIFGHLWQQKAILPRTQGCEIIYEVKHINGNARYRMQRNWQHLQLFKQNATQQIKWGHRKKKNTFLARHGEKTASANQPEHRTETCSKLLLVCIPTWDNQTGWSAFCSLKATRKIPHYFGFFEVT